MGLAGVLATAGPRTAPVRIVRVELLPFVEEAAPGPPAPAAAPVSPVTARIVPTPKPAAVKPPPKTKPPRSRAVTVGPTPGPVVLPERAGEALAGSASPSDGMGVPASVASAPPAVAASRNGAGRGAGTGGDEISAYVSRVRALVSRHQRYPPLARRQGLEGTVLVRLRIGEDGRVESAHANEGAPQLFARSALDAIDRAGRFPAPPRGALSIEVPMRFQLAGD